MNFVDVELAREGGEWVAIGKDDLRISIDAKGFEKGLGKGLEKGRHVTLGVRPHEVELASGSAGERAAGDTGVPFTVSLVEALGTESFAHGKIGGAPFVARVDAGVRLEKGALIDLAFKAIHLFDRESGRSLRDGA
jgi:sn-glycerol 3-phosphate transport system ATP-binding protein/multiple sugar transport system ATP-binding protein